MPTPECKLSVLHTITTLNYTELSSCYVTNKSPPTSPGGRFDSAIPDKKLLLNCANTQKKVKGADGSGAFSTTRQPSDKYLFDVVIKDGKGESSKNGTIESDDDESDSSKNSTSVSDNSSEDENNNEGDDNEDSDSSNDGEFKAGCLDSYIQSADYSSCITYCSGPPTSQDSCALCRIANILKVLGNDMSTHFELMSMGYKCSVSEVANFANSNLLTNAMGYYTRNGGVSAFSTDTRASAAGQSLQKAIRDIWGTASTSKCPECFNYNLGEVYKRCSPSCKLDRNDNDRDVCSRCLSWGSMVSMVGCSTYTSFNLTLVSSGSISLYSSYLWLLILLLMAIS